MASGTATVPNVSRTAAGWRLELKGAAGRTLVTGRIEGGRVIFP